MRVLEFHSQFVRELSGAFQPEKRALQCHWYNYRVHHATATIRVLNRYFYKTYITYRPLAISYSVCLLDDHRYVYPSSLYKDLAHVHVSFILTRTASSQLTVVTAFILAILS